MTEPGASLPDVFEYLDFRAFMRDFFEAKKAQNPRYSYRVFARSAGIQNQGLYIDVVKGRKKLSDNALDKVVKGLGLPERASRYFRLLVGYAQGKEAEKEECLQKIMRLRASRSFSPVEKNLQKYYGKWYFPVVREIVAVEGFGGDYGALSARVFPRITVLQAREAIRILTELGLIAEEGGRWSARGELKLRPNLADLRELIRSLHKQWVSHGAEAVDAFSPEDRYISSLMMAMPPRKMALLNKKFEQFKQDLLAEVQKSSPEDMGTARIYQFNFQMFPRSLA